MTKKGLFGFQKNGVRKVTYSHRDSHLKGLGRKVVRLCRNYSLDQLNKLYDELILVEEDDNMTEDQKQVYKKYLPPECWNEELDWTSVLKYSRDITAPILDGFKYLIEYGSFFGSMRCRWIYMINLDNNMLEISKYGFEVTGQESDIVDPSVTYPKERGPILVGHFPLDDIPDDWVEICELKVNVAK